MRSVGPDLLLSATDLSHFLACRHRTALEMGVARGKRRKPHFDDPLLEVLLERGLEHERAYVAYLAAQGLHVVELEGFKDPDPDQTLAAMRSGADVIVQGTLSDGRWLGHPDILRRVAKPSALGAWSYEVEDTKLARETRAGTILQLGLYSQLLGNAQGLMPEHFAVVTPDPGAGRTAEGGRRITRYRVDDFAAYFRLVGSQLEATVGLDDEAVAAANYPEPVEHCDICPWARQCNEKRHADDHLSLVAGISRVQRRELESREVRTLTDLGRLALPLPFKPARGAVETYERVREQARVQLESRGRTPPIHELRPVEAGLGLGRLPEPSAGDVFLDLEGDLFAAEGGREFLFGVVTLVPDGTPQYHTWWAFTEHEEHQAFEAVIDLIMRSWAEHSGMHVYHYAPYEPGALKRLMGRYATKEQELDRLLRGARFVDLYSVVRQGLRAGVERYSIKNLEVLYDFKRDVPLPDANRALRIMEHALELGSASTVPGEVRGAVAGYNKDDCVSALRLRDWLEQLRAEAIARGAVIPRPVPQEGEAPPEVDERAQRVADLRGRLLAGVPEAAAERSPEQHARWLLAYMLDFHRREDKATWWEYFRLRDLPEEDLYDEPQAVAGLEFVERVEVVRNKKTRKPTGSVVDRYRFPVQEMEIGPGEELQLSDDTKWGTLEAVDRIKQTIDVKKGRDQAETHRTAAFTHTYVNPAVIEGALFDLGERMAAGALTDLADTLLRPRSPKLRVGTLAPDAGEASVDLAVRVVQQLDQSVLAIQGPPGSGKTYSGAQMICALIRQGKKVGVTATSHKVIANLLDAVHDAATKSGTEVRLGHKREDDEPEGPHRHVTVLPGNPETLEAIQTGTVNVLGGTAWLWARDEFAGAADVLFVDEAGQMSLANALAVSRAAASMVLLGDPQQLNQPLQGSHPEGVDASALEHILGGHQTMPSDRGIFLPTTWRLAPRVCAFTSELFYEGRLHSNAGLERQRLSGVAGLDGAGLWMTPVVHEGNRNRSAEEVEVVAGLVELLTAPGARWTDEHGVTRQLSGQDILVVSPYNAQVGRLTERLERSGVRVGTVDKFQGQEAPVVIYSMATSRPEDAPRGMEFLYSLNRLNVATSRARCAAIVVASPRLFEPECQTPRQMQLANALCRFREMATNNG